ncbi:hypothetical protein VTN77DRAFT_3080 [Rasamsonia byssochlamydoides]|uniref:uncharacterized protein n=1 Tax=Rasamsonia byssochlamydoides TaxID=89139 RepID=UPI0037436D35
MQIRGDVYTENSTRQTMRSLKSPSFALSAQEILFHLQDITCFLPSGTSIFRPSSGMTETVFAGGRSTWDSILVDTFGTHLSKLLTSEAASAFVIYLRRIMNPVIAERSLQTNALALAVARLPELKCLPSSHPQKLNDRDKESHVLIEACGCRVCRPADSPCVP